MNCLRYVPLPRLTAGSGAPASPWCAWRAAALAALIALAVAAPGAATGAPVVVPPAPSGLSGIPGGPGSGEQVAIELPPSLVFQVYDIRGGPVAAREPFPVVWSGARLDTGNRLRISVRLETPGVRLAFQARSPRGGTCGNGYLTPGAFIRVFDGVAGATSGGCDLLWQIDSLGAVKRSGRYAVALRWRIESIGALGGLGGPISAASSAARLAGVPGTPAAGGGPGLLTAAHRPPAAVTGQPTAPGIPSLRHGSLIAPPST